MDFPVNSAFSVILFKLDPERFKIKLSFVRCLDSKQTSHISTGKNVLLKPRQMGNSNKLTINCTPLQKLETGFLFVCFYFLLGDFVFYVFVPGDITQTVSVRVIFTWK